MTSTYEAESLPRQSSSPSAVETQSSVNVGSTERWISGLAGGGLILLGLGRRSLGGLALAALGGGLAYRAYSGHCALYSALGISTNSASDDGAAPEEYFQRGIHVEESFTLLKPRGELFAFWRNLENLPSFMRHLESVRVLDDKRSHWIAKGPVGAKVEWDAEIINEQRDELLAWRSLDGATVDNAGSVRFIDAPQGGTELRVVLDYIPPLGSVGKIIAQLFGREPSQQIHEDLRRFKQLMEAGEIATTDGQPQGSCC